MKISDFGHPSPDFGGLRFTSCNARVSWHPYTHIAWKFLGATPKKILFCSRVHAYNRDLARISQKCWISPQFYCEILFKIIVFFFLVVTGKPMATHQKCHVTRDNQSQCPNSKKNRPISKSFSISHRHVEIVGVTFKVRNLSCLFISRHISQIFYRIIIIFYCI